MDSTTVVEFEPALAAVTIEALAAELRLTRDMLAEANDETDRLNKATADNETLLAKVVELTEMVGKADRDIEDLEEKLAAQVKYATALEACLDGGGRPEPGDGQ